MSTLCFVANAKTDAMMEVRNVVYSVSVVFMFSAFYFKIYPIFYCYLIRYFYETITVEFLLTVYGIKDIFHFGPLYFAS